MSVLIKGMSGCECCADCEFCGGPIMPDGIYTCDCPPTREMDITRATEEDCKSPDCPLVELPEKHGRLVDADALIAKCGDWYTEEGKEEGFIGTLEMLLKNVPTVVEAEGEMDYHSHLSPEQVRVLKPLVEENKNAIEEFKIDFLRREFEK